MQKNKVINVRVDQDTYELLVARSVERSQTEKRVVHLSEVVRDIVLTTLKK